MRRMLLVGVMLCSFSPMAKGAFDLQVTEIWSGNEPGSNLTDDWFEVTNLGDMPWTAAVDGDLYYDDDSADTTKSDLMSGIASIAPGESVVFVDGQAAGDPNLALWSSVWSNVVSPLPQLGSYEGAGLGKSGDGVALFLDADFNGPTGSELVELATYPNAENNGGQSYDVLLGSFSTPGNASGAVATTALNDESQPAIGSPGQTVPEPGALLLGGAGLLALLGTRRR